MSKLTTSAILAALATVVCAGCASERVKAELKKQKENKDGYVWVYPTGSNIPVLVPKDQAKTSAKTTTDSQAALEEAQRMKSMPNKGPSGSQ